MIRFLFFLSVFVLFQSSSYANEFSNLTGDYLPTMYCENSNEIWISNVAHIIIKENSLTFNECAFRENCEGRIPYYHYFLKNITSNKEGIISAEMNGPNPNKEYQFKLIKTSNKIILFSTSIHDKLEKKFITCHGSLEPIEAH